MTAQTQFLSRPKRFVGIVLLLSALFPPFSSAAARYELVEGQGIEVCEAYERNLNSFKPKVPMTCARAINPELKGFEAVEWDRSPLTLTGVPTDRLYEEMTELLWERDVNPVYGYPVNQWPEWQGTPEQLKQARHAFDVSRDRLSTYRPYLAKFDVDNDGADEPVYLERPCGSIFGTRFAILTDDWRHIDRGQTKQLMPHPPFRGEGRGVFRPIFPSEIVGPFQAKYGYTAIEDAWGNAYYDVFRYKGRFYLDQWWSRHPDFKGEVDMKAGRLRVFEPSSKGTRRICSYRFIYRIKEEK